MKTTPAPSPPAAEVSQVLVSTGQIQRRVAALARRIDRDYRSCDSLLLVGILRGAFTSWPT